MMKKTQRCAVEGGAYSSSPGVKAGLHSEAYWLHLRPVWTDKAAVWSHLMTAPEACWDTFFFFFSLAALLATTFTSATEAQTSCALLCVCVSDLSGFEQLAGDGATEKESLCFAISRLRFHTAPRPFCWFPQTSVSAWRYLADLGAELLGTGCEARWEKRWQWKTGSSKQQNAAVKTFNRSKWRRFGRRRHDLINTPEVQNREQRAKDRMKRFLVWYCGRIYDPTLTLWQLHLISSNSVVVTLLLLNNSFFMHSPERWPWVLLRLLLARLFRRGSALKISQRRLSATLRKGKNATITKGKKSFSKKQNSSCNL